MKRDEAIQHVALGMFDSIRELHTKTKYVHRDIKPENFRVSNGKVYTIDFGLATEYEKDGRHIEE